MDVGRILVRSNIIKTDKRSKNEDHHKIALTSAMAQNVNHIPCLFISFLDVVIFFWLSLGRSTTGMIHACLARMLKRT